MLRVRRSLPWAPSFPASERALIARFDATFAVKALAEEVVLRLAYERACAALAAAEPHTPGHGRGDAVRLAHDQLRRRGELVGDGDEGHPERHAEVIHRAPVVDD